ncbi:hypothetical protein ABK040_016706 [Willaertia magna]
MLKNIKVVLKNNLKKNNLRFYHFQNNKLFNDNYQTLYNNYMNDTSQKIVDLIYLHKSCQFSSFGGSENTDTQSIKTSVLPFALVKKEISNIYLDELKKKTKELDNNKIDPNYVMYDDDSFPGYDDFGETMNKFDIYLCIPEWSEHLSNLSHCPEPFQLRRKLREDETSLTSIAIGHADKVLSSLFQRINRLPPRAVLGLTLEQIPNDSEAFQRVWTEQFRLHPNISLQLKKEKVKIFRNRALKSAYYVDVSNQMKQVDDLEHLVNVNPDPIASSPNSRIIIDRLNGNPERLKSFLLKGYNLNLSDFFVFEINSFGMKIMGRDASYGGGRREPEQFAEYVIDFGERVSTENALQRFLTKFNV